ncbi:MAG: carbohydrate kinase [Anaerolineae bacterium]|nr:carbohydrate kinase [Anaerolineae bacterium]
MTAKQKDFLLGIDVGTTLIKSALFDLDGHMVALSSAGVGLEHPSPGWAEQDMDAVWRATSQTIREAVQAADQSGGKIAAISTSGQGGGMWLIDRDGRPVRKGITWLDGRAGEFFPDWEKAGIIEELDESTGYHTFPGVGPLLIFHWFKKHDPNILSKAYKTLWAKDWVKFKLTGVVATDESDPSNGHFLRGERQFSEPLFEMLEVKEYMHLLPPIVPSWQVMGKVNAEAAAETGLQTGVPVASGAWDVSSTGLGAGCIREGQTLSILGTAGIHLSVSAAAPQEKKAPYSACVHCVPGHWVVNSMAMTATSNLDWFIRESCQADKDDAERTGKNFFEIINARVAASPVGAGGVIFLPFLQGERAPFVKPNARGVFFGISDATTRGDLLRSIYEGVAFSARHNYEVIERAIPIREVVLSGGGSKSAVWSQIVSDCTNKPMTIPAGEEFGALGAALNAGVAVGIYKDHREAASHLSIARRHQPDTQNHALYQGYYEIYRQLIKNNWETWEKLAEIRNRRR